MGRLICTKCNEELVLLPASVDYLGYHIAEKLPRCPTCGQIYISEELARGKISEVELELEQK